jgi:pyrimidine-specific ribonucleoside hydrolase
MDDMRAISIILSRKEIVPAAISLCDGSLTPAESSQKVRSLLAWFGRNDIPVYCGQNIEGVNPPWREFNSKVKWSREIVDASTCIGTDQGLPQAIRKNGNRITLVCLGPLTNIYGILKNDPSLKSGIERIVWYNESLDPLKGFNYECDPESAGKILNLGIRIDVISNLGKKVLFDETLYNLAGKSETKLASNLYYVHSQKEVLKRLKEQHFWLCDELVSLYLTNPELFDMNLSSENLGVRYNTGYNAASVKEALSEMIEGSYNAGNNVVFNAFPSKRELFSYDIRDIVDTAIALYGPEEWKANVMTDEFHGHLGVFSIVGAKMGIRARELFGVGPDELRVITFAGSKPPYSCLTDGIQVSTGATLGMGTISLASDPVSSPSAIFTYKDHSVRITLKKEYLDKVDADIAEGILKFGLMDDGYWKLVRRNAIKYWIEWDRKKIFDIDEIKSGKGY